MKVLLTICLLVMPSIATAQNASLARAQIKEAESRLAEMGYWTGRVDGIFDPVTGSALIAFQKWEGRPITGRLTINELDTIRISTSPKAREPGYEHVEVDVNRQVLLLVDEHDAVRVLPISTGSGKPFISDGQNSVAYTPRGRFMVYDKVAGWESPANAMYYSSYISGGVAIHGYRSVPTAPASHGCIRIPVFAAREVSKLMPLGTIVLVYDEVSFVSAKDWVENPALKQAALAASVSSGFDDYSYQTSEPKNSKPFVIKRARPRITRAD